MPMQHRRTLTVGATPTGLAEGQISVGMADRPPTAWAGVPTSVNPLGVIPITGLVRTVAGAPQPAGALGQLWWDEDAAQLYVYTGNQWVVAVNPPIPDLSGFVAKTGDTMSGALTINVAGGGQFVSNGAPAQFIANKTAATGAVNEFSSFVGQTNGVMRWAMVLGGQDAETGANAGSNFSLTRYDDAGTQFPQSVIVIERAAGHATFSNNVNLLGDLGVQHGGTIGSVSNVAGLTYDQFNGCIIENPGTALSVNRYGSNGNVAHIYQASILCGSISVADAATTSFNTTSDDRLKIADQPIDPGYAGQIIDGIEPIRFSWRERRDTGPQYGFSAQALNEVFPSAVTPGTGNPGDEDFIPWMMDASKLIPILVAEIKDLRARVIALESKT